MPAHDPRPAPIDAAPPLPTRGPAPSRLGTRRKFLFAALTSAAVLLFLALAAELTLRLRHGKPLTLHSTLSPTFQRLGDAHAAYDANLGWVPRPGRWDFGPWSATIDQHGLRSNGSLNDNDNDDDDDDDAHRAPVILAVGDSFTFGDEVDDHQTWPAHLQQHTGARVLNAGVFAYGADQAVLRAETMLESYDPDWIVVALIAHDVRRAEFSYYFAHKPYFDLAADRQLVLHNTPVPRTPATQKLPRLRRVLGYSYAARSLFSRIAPDWWRGVTIRREHERGADVTIQLIRRLSAAAAQRNARILVLGLGVSQRLGGNAGLADVLISLQDVCNVLDLSADLPDDENDDTITGNREIFRPNGHYADLTNAWVARRVAEHLSRKALADSNASK